MRTHLAAATMLGLIALASRAAAAPAPEDAWLDHLAASVIADAAAGRPLVVQVHVPLCDNTILRCGNARLGDGNSPRTNLYWATGEGFAGWFGRRGTAWKQVLDSDGTAVADDDVLDVRVWRRSLATSTAWRRRGAPGRIDVYLVVQAWRGTAIDRGLAAYFDDLYRDRPRRITLSDGAVVDAGGAARIVAYVGHNRLMDVDTPDWTAMARASGTRTKGAVAIACHTAAYMAKHLPAPTRVPLLMTRDFLMASAPTLDGAVVAFAAGGDYRAIRRGAAAGYADGQDKPVEKVAGAFTNPGDRRWQR
jgi:hypothetical protein